MKSKIGSSVKTVFCTAIFIFIGFVACYVINYYNIYKSIHVSVSKSAIIEYGSPNYDINNLVDSVNGEIISIKKDIDTTKVGTQEIIVEVKKNDIIKEVPIVVEVKDTIAPEIKVKEQAISLTAGDAFDAFSNLESVYDMVDGSLDYQAKEIVDHQKNTNYYTIESNVDSNVAGIYTVTVKAVDRYGNVSTMSYQVEVKEKVQEIIPPQVVVPVYHNDYVGVGNMSQLVQLAYSLIGSPYVSGGNSPAGFDCSGFVQYVYSQVGIGISRSSTTQMNDGVAVSYDAAQPGDILSWGYADGVSTHSAIYVGNGQMIHSTNPKQGVILSDVAGWTRGSGTHVIAVRRI